MLLRQTYASMNLKQINKIMKTPSTLTVISRILRKLKAIPDNYGVNFSRRNPLVEYAVKLLETIPEQKRASKTFKKNARLLFQQVFLGRSHSQRIIKPFFQYIGQDFIDEEVLCNSHVFDYEKAQFVSKERLYDYYETQSLINLDFKLDYQERTSISEWFKQLAQEKKNYILHTRLTLVTDKVEVSEVLEWCEDQELLLLTAEKVERLHLWSCVFYDEKCFDPSSTEGKKLEKLAKYLHPELWMSYELSRLDPYKSNNFKFIDQIIQYFGNVKVPPAEVRRFIDADLERGLRANFPSYFKLLN